MLHVGISPGIFLLFCMAVCYTRLLSLGMAVCDYASLVTLIQPIQNATFLGKNVPKIIFAIMGGSKYFSDLFRPQFSEHVAQFQHSGAPSGKVGPPFKLTFFWTEYCLCSRCIIQKWLDKCNWNWTKSICQITRNHKQPYKREEIYRGKSLHVA
jgi:hypothetical protein